MENKPRTIVGGRAEGRGSLRACPRGIEILLKKAKVDPVFREEFLEDPLASAQAIGLPLLAAEKKMLASVPQPTLLRHSMIHFTDRAGVASLERMIPVAERQGG